MPATFPSTKSGRSRCTDNPFPRTQGMLVAPTDPRKPRNSSPIAPLACRKPESAGNAARIRSARRSPRGTRSGSVTQVHDGELGRAELRIDHEFELPDPLRRAASAPSWPRPGTGRERHPRPRLEPSARTQGDAHPRPRRASRRRPRCAAGARCTSGRRSRARARSRRTPSSSAETL